MPDVVIICQGGSRVAYTDQVLTCADCGIDFVFSASEQEFFAQKGFTSAPKRCPSCRAQRRATGGGAATAHGGELQRRRWLQPWPSRDVRCGVRAMRQGHAGPVPPDRCAPGLLQRLLPADARLVPHRASQTPTLAAVPFGGRPASAVRPCRVVARPVPMMAERGRELADLEHHGRPELGAAGAAAPRRLDPLQRRRRLRPSDQLDVRRRPHGGAGRKYLHYDFDAPDDPRNDHLIFSKGHASPLLYAIYKAAGAIATRRCSPSASWAAGSRATPRRCCRGSTWPPGRWARGCRSRSAWRYAGQATSIGFRIGSGCLCGDSEMAEGSMWEAFEAAGFHGLDNLTAIIDVNRLGQTGETMHGWDLDAYVEPGDRRSAGTPSRSMATTSLRSTPPWPRRSRTTAGRP